MVWNWVRKFQRDCTNVHDESRRECPYHGRKCYTVQDKILKDHGFKISELCKSLPQVSHGALFEIVKNCLGYCKLCIKNKF